MPVNSSTSSGGLPLVGMTSRTDGTNILLRSGYSQAIARAGGIPWVLPILPEGAFPEWVERLDALILSGGEDVNPMFFNEQPHARLGGVHTARDRFELGLARQWLASGKPMLGICRGCQLLQVAAGGRVFQDIAATVPGALRHEQKGERGDPAHWVTIREGSTLARLLGTGGDLEVNSIHHQAVAEPATGFHVVARACDGVVEAIEASDGRLVLGVQWHPEEMEAPQQKRLFARFMEEVALHKGKAVSSRPRASSVVLEPV